MSSPSFGFVGFGEAASRIASGLCKNGVGEMFAYDSATAPAAVERIRSRAAEAKVILVASNAELAARSSIVFSLVTAVSAKEAARENAPHLLARHIYIDCNSVSPDTKGKIAKLIQSSQSQFIEAAVMAPVPKKDGQRVPMLVNGEGAAAIADSLSQFGFNMEPLLAPVGTAAAVKMCRSIVIKGLEALMTECVLGASQYGVEDRVFASLQKSYPGIDWNQLASYMINRLTVHGERRAREMEEVAETLRSAGIEPIMSEAAARRQDWSAKLCLAANFSADGPATYQEVLDVLSKLQPGDRT